MCVCVCNVHVFVYSCLWDMALLVRVLSLARLDLYVRTLGMTENTKGLVSSPVLERPSSSDHDLHSGRNQASPGPKRMTEKRRQHLGDCA